MNKDKVIKYLNNQIKTRAKRYSTEQDSELLQDISYIKNCIYVLRGNNDE